MSELLGILGDPYRRTKTLYHFKVTKIEGDKVTFHDASKVTNTMVLPNDNDVSLEEQYVEQMDNLFISVSITGEFFFSAKLSNTNMWPGFHS